MVSIASAASVFIPSDIVPGRMSLCVTSFLSLISLFNGARNNWTKTTHMRAIDVWVVLCYIGVFYSLVEYVFIIYLTKYSSGAGKLVHSKYIGTEDDQDQEIIKPKKYRVDLARKIENVSCVLLPLYNILF